MTVTVVYSDLSDKYIYCSNTDMQTAMDGGGSFSTSATTTSIYTGAFLSGATHIYMEGYFRFDTSAVGTDSVSDAVFSAISSANNTTIDVLLEFRALTWDGASGSGDWKTTAQLAALTRVASINTSVYVNSVTYIDHTSDAAFTSEINGSGYTSIIGHFDGHATSTAATGKSYFWYRSSDTTGTTQDPKLTITHAAATGRIMGGIAGQGGLAGPGGLAGSGGGLAG